MAKRVPATVVARVGVKGLVPLKIFASGSIFADPPPSKFSQHKHKATKTLHKISTHLRLHSLAGLNQWTYQNIFMKLIEWTFSVLPLAFQGVCHSDLFLLALKHWFLTFALPRLPWVIVLCFKFPLLWISCKSKRSLLIGNFIDQTCHVVERVRSRDPWADVLPPLPLRHRFAIMLGVEVAFAIMLG